jgi:hypothetical protein
MKLPQSLVAGIAAGMLLLSAGVAPATAADAPRISTATTPTAENPGPAGDFSWKGYNWQKRNYGGGPHYNGLFSAANVTSPDAQGHVTLSLTNPTGTAPVASELISTKRGWGYGTYQTTVEKDLSAMQDETVWGCLFTYDPAAAPGHTEIDLCEASAWGGGPSTNPWPIVQGHGYWHDATKEAGVGSNTVNFPVTSNANLTHTMVWEPGKITFQTFAGESASGVPLKRTVLEGPTVPVPANEAIHFNLWATGGGGGTPDTMKPETAIIKDFSFTPRGSSTPVPVPAPAPVVPAPAPAPAPAPSPTQPAPAPAPAPSPKKPVKPAPAPSPKKPVPAPAPAPAKIALTTSTTTVSKTATTTLRWSGATGQRVTLVTNGSKRSVPNTGTFVSTVKGKKTTTYRVCDSTRCSATVSVTTR